MGVRTEQRQRPQGHGSLPAGPLMRSVRAAFAAVAVLIPGVANAEPDTERTIDLGARAGLALPFGAIERGSRESDLTFGAVPLGIDGGLVLSRYVTLGAL